MIDNLPSLEGQFLCVFQALGKTLGTHSCEVKIESIILGLIVFYPTFKRAKFAEHTASIGMNNALDFALSDITF